MFCVQTFISKREKMSSFWLVTVGINVVIALATNDPVPRDALNPTTRCSGPGMGRHKNSCFWIDNRVMSNYKAEEACQKDGGHLAAPRDYATQQFIKELTHGGQYNSYWMGLREVDNNKWTFTDHTPLGSFSYWAPNEPGGARDEDCVLLASHANTRWTTTQCHWGYRFICEVADREDTLPQATFCDENLLQSRDQRIRQDGNTARFQRSRDGTIQYPIGVKLEVECTNKLEVISGPSHVHCEIGGKWSNSSRCSMGCSRPNLLPSIQILHARNLYAVGEHVQIGCDENHILDGSLTCNQSGTWVGKAPRCIPRHDPIPQPSQPQVSCPQKKPIPEPEVVSLYLGASVLLPCVKDLQTWKQGLWMKEQAVLDRSNTNISNVSVLSNGTLHISHMTPAIEGLYTCVAFSQRHKDEVKSHSVRVVLHKECNIKFENSPTVHVLSTTVFILLRCNAKEATISWHSKNRPLENDNHHVLLANGAVLVKNSRSDYMAEEYICRAEHVHSHCRIEKSVVLPLEGSIQELCGKVHIPVSPPEVRGGQQRGKLVGGHVAEKASHPWLVIFVNFIDGHEKFLCGGNLISHRWVATAAHCFYWVGKDEDLKSLKAKLGKHDRLEVEEHQIVLNLESLVRHPQFDTKLRSFDNDLALVRLSDQVPFSRYIVPICLPPQGFLSDYFPVRYTQSSGTVSGWGRLEENGLQPRYLHQVRLPLVDHAKCKASTDQHVSENMFCAGYEQAVGDSCQGDSGGPFEMANNGSVVLAGVVSWGEGCARPGNYGFYTKVENYKRFIHQHVNDID